MESKVIFGLIIIITFVSYRIIKIAVKKMRLQKMRHENYKKIFKILQQ